jgi:uncharacterized tellurite resistance protein B-like protein
MDILKIFKTDHDGIRKSHMKNLICVAMADGKVGTEEWDLLLAISATLGITEEEVEEIKKNPQEVKFVAPKKYEEKVEQIHDLVAIMTVDGHINQKELDLCKKISLRLDILPQMVDDILTGIMAANSTGANMETV